MESVNFQGQTLTRWRVGNSTFLALPEHGARLMNWNVTLGDGTVRDVIYWPEHADFANFPKIRGGNPILFPFCGRTYDQGEQGFWRDLRGVRRPMPQHGFARQSRFKTLWCDARGFSAQLIPDAAAQEAYPFDYEFVVTYRFEPLALACEFSLKNLGDEPLPWSAGHHFYFTLPWTDGATRADYTVRLSAAERLRHEPTGPLIPGPQLPPEENLANPELIDTLFTQLRSNEAVVSEKGRGGTISVQLGTQKIPSRDATFVTWSGSDDAPYYCVEPWMSPPNAPEHRRGLGIVPPRETARFSVVVAVR